MLKDILEEENFRNAEGYETATVTKHDFWGILKGEDYWGANFVSVTSETTGNYKIVRPKSFAYNPSRANTGSLCLNLSGSPLAVSPMYVTFRVINKNFLSEYIFLYLKSKEGIQSIKDRSFGSVRQALRYDDLCTIAIPDIPLSRQQKIAAKADEMYAAFSKIKKSLDAFDILQFI